MKDYLHKVLKLFCLYDKIAGMIGFWRFLHSARSAAIPSIEMTSGKGMRALKPFAPYLLPLKILFCVCLAHAGQRGLAFPAAAGVAFQQAYPITGTVLSATDNSPLEGATVSIQGKQLHGLTDVNGAFKVLTRDSIGALVVSFVGYKPIKITFSRKETGPFVVRLEPTGNELQEVEVSTGYQTMPKERATGSFEYVGKELLSRRVSTNILDRLDGVSASTFFNNSNARQAGQSDIQIRGRSTLFGNADPLIVLDNFPYEGDLGDINPNDIESVSILKDASAASIWGVRAGNGVIVLTSKKGKREQGPTIQLNTNITIGEQSNLYYAPQLTSAEFIDVERFLFEKGYYNASINNGYSPLSPLVEILQQHNDGILSSIEVENRLAVLASQDVRRDMLNYARRAPVNQQYQLSVTGGGKANRYYLSAGYDRNLAEDITASYRRFTLNANHDIAFWDGRLEFTNQLFIAETGNEQKGEPYTTARYPYQLIADQEGRALSVAKDLRQVYIDTAGQGRLLDWNYRPLDELRKGYTRVNNDQMMYRLNNAVRLRLLDGMHLYAQYVFEKSRGETSSHYNQESYYVRNLINTYTQIDPITGEMALPVPVGGILNTRFSSANMHNGRIQLSYNKVFGKVHELSFLGGYELRHQETEYQRMGLYGFNPQTMTNNNAAVDYTTPFPYYYNNNTARIPTNTGGGSTVDRYRSYFSNVSYTYKDRYILSGSIRKDESNLFGVRSNQRGVPLWSVGASWAVADESFYHLDWLPYLRARFTYGYNGNVNKSVSAYLTSTAGRTVQNWNAQFLEILNPPNPALRWERVENVNLAIDFAVKDNWLSGSIEYWRKNGRDLIGLAPIAPQTGLVEFTGNTAATNTNGWELNIQTQQLKRRVSWSTYFIFNRVRDKVVQYYTAIGPNANIVSGNYSNPLVDYPQYGLFSYAWAGLDQEGDPQGWLDGEISTNYGAIRNLTEPDQLVYHGSTMPTTFGSSRNDFSYLGFGLSFNVTFKAGHYFRRSSIQYTTLFAGNYEQRDFSERWQEAGDEERTNVPAMVYPANSLRDGLYAGSEVLVERGDHIRFQDIQLSYTLPSSLLPKWGMKSCRIYAYVNNLGILWTRNDAGIDPDFPYGLPKPRTYAIGLTANF